MTRQDGRIAAGLQQGRNDGALRLMALLLMTAAIGVSQMPAPALAQTAAPQRVVDFRIPAQSLETAIDAFIGQSGWQITYPAGAVAGQQSVAVSGLLSPEDALRRMIGAAGALSVVVSGPGTAALVAAPARLADGSILFDELVIVGRAGAYWDGSAEAVYQTTANVDSVSRENLESYQISTPSDLLRNTTGVLSGDARNSGSLNVNIHGLQGQGRVPVTVDGAENNTTVYRGYQGIADRSFIDPDFVASVGIERGASTARGGIGGTVAATTITASDIVQPGRKSGFRLRFSALTNTSDPVRGTLTGEGADRPAALEPTGGAASLTYAYQGDLVEMVAGFSLRQQGNYHAGSTGETEGYTYSQSGAATWGQLSPYSYGDEVLNTSSDNHSALLKLTFNFSEDLKWQLGYSKYNTQFGEIMPSRYTTLGFASQWRLTETEMDSLTSRLRWNPSGNDWVDVRWNLWRTALDTQSAPIFDFTTILPRSSDVTVGTDASNTAQIYTGWGDITWTTGVSLKHEESRATAIAPDSGAIREGERDEAAIFTTAEWRVNEWIALNGGLRSSYAETMPAGSFSGPKQTHDAFDHSLGFAVFPHEAVSFYANYRYASRMPSLYEMLLQSMNVNNPMVEPETVRNLDVGVNVETAGPVGDDTVRIKLSYFENDVRNYIARNMGALPTGGFSMHFLNLDSAYFEGIDLSAEYVRGGFTAKLGATRYTDIGFCYNGVCGENGLGTDYAKNQIPPAYQISLDMSQKLLDDQLTLGGRFTRYGPRATEPLGTITTSSLIAPVEWNPYALVDLYAHYQLNADTRLSLDIQNIGDEFYVEPLSLAPTPGPGRSARISIDYRF